MKHKCQELKRCSAALKQKKGKILIFNKFLMLRKLNLIFSIVAQLGEKGCSHKIFTLSRFLSFLNVWYLKFILKIENK